MERFLENDTSYISIHGIPLTVLDLCASRGIDTHRLLSGTRLFLADWHLPDKKVSPEQLLRLLANVDSLLPGKDSFFQLGRRLLPGNEASASHALTLSADLNTSIDLLDEFQTLLLPLIRPVPTRVNGALQLVWEDICGTDYLREKIILASITAVVGYTRSQNKGKHGWEIFLRQKRPQQLEQYLVNLGEAVHFEQPCNRMIMRAGSTCASSGQTAGPGLDIVRTQARRQLQQLPGTRTFLAAVTDWLNQHVEQNPRLESLATDLSISPATLKRKLKKHHTHFQEMLDQARLAKALALLGQPQESTESVAQRLCFHDAASFRRAFKRWTGRTPSHAPFALPINH